MKVETTLFNELIEDEDFSYPKSILNNIIQKLGTSDFKEVYKNDKIQSTSTKTDTLIDLLDFPSSEPSHKVDIFKNLKVKTLTPKSVEKVGPILNLENIFMKSPVQNNKKDRWDEIDIMFSSVSTGTDRNSGIDDKFDFINNQLS